MTLDQAQPSDFDAVMLPGGALHADFLRLNPKAQNFVRQFDSSSKPMAIICHAPWLLVQEMVRDRNWVTSRSPKDLRAFNPAMVSLFAESKTKAPQL